LRHLVALFFFSIAGQAFADERPLTGAEISHLLTGATVITPRANGHEIRQEFHANGSTLYEDVELSWGRWDVRGDKYCSQWPPQQGWVCYDMASWYHDDARWVVWVGESGTRYEGRIAP